MNVALYRSTALAIALIAFQNPNSFAAVQNDDPDARSVSVEASVNDKVNAWVDGTVLSVNAESGKF